MIKMTTLLTITMLMVVPSTHAQGVEPAPALIKQNVLLINLVEPQLMHSHLGVTPFSSSERPLESNWEFEKKVAETATQILESVGYQVTSVDQESMPSDSLGSTWFPQSGLAKPKLHPEFVSWLKLEKEKAGSSVILLLRTYGRPYGPTINKEYSGYGVMSIHGDPPKHAFLFANILVNVLSGDSFSPEKIARLKDSDCRVRVDLASLGGGSFKSWTGATFNAYMPDMLALAEKRIRQDLTAAGLLPGPIERCVLAPP